MEGDACYKIVLLDGLFVVAPIMERECEYLALTNPLRLLFFLSSCLF